MTEAMTALWQRWRQSQKQRIYIIPSRAGYGYVALLLLMLLGAINYNNSLGHLLCFLLASIGHVTMHQSHTNLRLLTLKVTALDAVFKGQPARFRLTVNNHDEHDKYQIEIAGKKPGNWPRWQFFKAYEKAGLLEHVEADNTRSINLGRDTHQRGWQPLGDLRLASLYPLGLFYTWTVYQQSARVLVYPEPAGKRPLPQPPGSDKQRTQREHSGDDDFSGLRNYREGEPLHRVAWKALARDEVMRSKQFSSPEGHQLIFRWQDLADINDTEARLSQLCRWVLEAESAGHRYGLELPDSWLPPSQGDAHQHQCLKKLALYHG